MMKTWIIAALCLLLSSSRSTFAGRVRSSRHLQTCTGEVVTFTTSFIFEAAIRPSEITDSDTNMLADIMQTAYSNAAGCDSPGAFINVKEVRVDIDVTETLPDIGASTVTIPFLVEFDLECLGCSQLGSVFENVGGSGGRRTRAEERGKRSSRSLGKKGGKGKGKGGKYAGGDNDDVGDGDNAGGDEGIGNDTDSIDTIFDNGGCDCELPTLSTFLLACNNLLVQIGSINAIGGGSQLQPAGTSFIAGGVAPDLGTNSFSTFIGVEVSCVGCSRADFDNYASGFAFSYNILNYLNPNICDPNGRVATSSMVRSLTQASRVGLLSGRGSGRRTQVFNGSITVVIEIMTTCQINCEDQTVIFGDHDTTGRKLAVDGVLCPNVGFTFGCPTLPNFVEAIQDYSDLLVSDGTLPPSFQLVSLDEFEPPAVPATPTNSPSDFPSASPSAFPTLSQETASELRTCVAIIDETQNSFNNAYFNAQWAEFRATFPLRSFCLIRVVSTIGAVYVPPALLADNNTIVPDLIPTDNGDDALASDFFNLCKLSEIPRSITNVAIFIDTSSLPAANFQASFDLFDVKLEEAGLENNRQFNNREDYITPFIRDIF